MRGEGELPETVVTFPAGDIEAEATVLTARLVPGGVLVVTDRTPFHPLDPAWPDQPDDHGRLDLGPATYRVHRSLTALVTSPTGDMLLDSEIQVRRGTPGATFLVGHLIGNEPDQLSRPDRAVLTGARVRLRVDPDRRHRLSAAHTACHLVAYAVNECTDHLWRKPAATNSRGHRDFDRAALVSSRHSLSGSVDVYRLGKSLHRKGFDHERLRAELDHVLAATNSRLREWLAADLPVHIDVPQDRLTSPRQWSCPLPGGTATMPCGGTHVRTLSELASIAVSARLDDENQELSLVAETTVRQRSAAGPAHRP